MPTPVAASTSMTISLEVREMCDRHSVKSCGCRLLESVFAQFVAKSSQGNTQQFRCMCAISIRLFERCHDQLAFHLIDGLPRLKRLRIASLHGVVKQVGWRDP